MPAIHSMVLLDSFNVFLTHKTMETTRPRPTFPLLSNALMPVVESAWARCALPTLRLATLSLLSFIVSPVTFSAEIRYVPDRDGGRRITDLAHVEIVGEIIKGDVGKLRGVLSKAKAGALPASDPIVVLDSPGGNVQVALNMGTLLRESLAHTIVDRGGSCSSSCVFLLAGGVSRDVFMNGRIGLHRPRFDYEEYGNLSKDQAKFEYNSLVMRCAEFMKKMGVSEQVFSDMLKVPSQNIRFVDRDYAEEHGLVGTDPGWEEWSRAQQVKKFGEAKVRAQDRLVDCYNSSTVHSVCDERYKQELNEINGSPRRAE